MLRPKIRIVSQQAAANRAIALEIATLIRNKHFSTGATLGLATGHTPIQMYRELVRMHQQEKLDWSRVTTFNLDEYVGITPENTSSFRHWMQYHLFEHINILPQNTHILDGLSQNIKLTCENYERTLAGKIDLQILGVGMNGHVAFNEPGSCPKSRTRKVLLSKTTRSVNQSDFHNSNIPTHALTMGIGTIKEAKRLRILAFGKHKAAIIARAMQHDPTSEIPITLLWTHPNVEIWLDKPSASLL